MILIIHEWEHNNLCGVHYTSEFLNSLLHFLQWSLSLLHYYYYFIRILYFKFVLRHFQEGQWEWRLLGPTNCPNSITFLFLNNYYLSFITDWSYESHSWTYNLPSTTWACQRRCDSPRREWRNICFAQPSATQVCCQTTFYGDTRKPSGALSVLQYCIANSSLTVFICLVSEFTLT